MPHINSISDSKNLSKVDNSDREYLIRNAYDANANAYFEDAEKLDRLRSVYEIVSDLKRAEERANKTGWISQEQIEKEMGI